MNLNVYSWLAILGLTGFSCLALGFSLGRMHGYREGCADTIEMYEWFRSDNQDWEQAVKNKKILDMFTEEE